MDTVTTLTEVRTAETRVGNTRYIARDSDGKEYTTFREEIGREPDGQVDPDELYEKLKPFEQRVAADIEAERRE